MEHDKMSVNLEKEKSVSTGKKGPSGREGRHEVYFALGIAPERAGMNAGWRSAESRGDSPQDLGGKFYEFTRRDGGY